MNKCSVCFGNDVHLPVKTIDPTAGWSKCPNDYSSEVFELYDEVLEERLSLHSTLKGALLQMSKTIANIAPALSRDCEGQKDTNFTLKYRVKAIKVRE